MRSILFVPGNKIDWIAKAITSDADGIIIDLEDAVAPENKEIGRQTVKRFLEETADSFKKVITVRINSLKTLEGLRDILALKECRRAPDIVMLPKTESAGEVAVLAELLSEINDSIGIFLVLESVKGLRHANEIAASSEKVKGLLFGGGDYSGDLGCDFCWDNMFSAREKVVTAAALARIEAVDVPYIALDDLDGLKKETKKIAAMGFTGKAAIHPKQIATINEMFLPGVGQIDWANRIMRAVSEGGAGAIRLDGKMVDAATVRSAKRILKLVGEKDAGR